MSTVAELYWDPYDAALAREPHPVFARLREEMPLYHNEKHNFYAVSRFADVQRGLADWRTYTSTKGDILDLIQSGIEIPPGTLIFEDPPVHDLHRRLLARVFTPRRIAMLEPQARAFCRSALDPVRDTDRFDLVEAVSAQMPMRVIGMLLGIPEADQAAIRDQTDATLATEDGQRMSQEGLLSFEVFKDYIAWRKNNPSDDLMTELMTAEFEDENGVTRTLTDDEVLTYCTVVAGAGNETTGRLIGWFGALMARYPGQRRELVDDPSLIPNAIEEILRFEPTGPFTARYVTRDAEWYGQTVPAGSAMLFIQAAANRDPRRYDDPDTFDIHRVAQQLSFGVGAHYCLGAALARLEGRIAAEEILGAFPSWEVDWDNAELAQTSTVRGYKALPLIVG
ncbi:cytochrome P450 [Amycolatopsis sp. K13G38]|uniref:Cytochrome P450 n=1 Tax=Amycolatopsis acididurans TaxID=2724524 RepID=A0ABX1JGF7_9PSEU|nr:cytochrome P450 [Amycolatopsis acididurans]NKQ58875.1 cytochrome P450 [Amycolatopsis acididurans]